MCVPILSVRPDSPNSGPAHGVRGVTMADAKIKIKLLGEELSTSPKDMLRILRDLGIPARTSSGSVSPEEAARVRAHVAEQKQAEAGRVDSHPNVIVRRRRKESVDAPAEAPAAAVASSPEAPETEASETEAALKAGASEAAAPAPEAAAPRCVRIGRCSQSCRPCCGGRRYGLCCPCGQACQGNPPARACCTAPAIRRRPPPSLWLNLRPWNPKSLRRLPPPPLPPLPQNPQSSLRKRRLPRLLLRKRPPPRLRKKVRKRPPARRVWPGRRLCRA